MEKESNLDGDCQKGQRGEGREERTYIEHLLYSPPCVMSIILFNTQISPGTH